MLFHDSEGGDGFTGKRDRRFTLQRVEARQGAKMKHVAEAEAANAARRGEIVGWRTESVGLDGHRGGIDAEEFGGTAVVNTGDNRIAVAGKKRVLRQLRTKRAGCGPFVRLAMHKAVGGMIRRNGLRLVAARIHFRRQGAE